MDCGADLARAGRAGQKQQVPANARLHPSCHFMVPPLCSRGRLRKNVAQNDRNMPRTGMLCRNRRPDTAPTATPTGAAFAAKARSISRRSRRKNSHPT